MSKSFRLVFFVAILELALLLCQRGDRHEAARGEGETYATTNNTVSVKLSDIPVGKVIQVGELKFVKVGGDQYMSISPCADPVLTTTGTSKNFDYTGGQQTYTAYVGCEYKLEVWGAQGGILQAGPVGTKSGGYGSYSVGIYMPTSIQTIYINVGGQGSNTTYALTRADAAGGYNGGGTGYAYWGSGPYSTTGGGGATHLALDSGLLKDLSSHATDGRILIVAGGGGGGISFNTSDTSAGGCWGYPHLASGGGYQGAAATQYPHGSCWTTVQPTGGSQSSGGVGTTSYYGTGTSTAAAYIGKFGLGASYVDTTATWGGGGGGYYGGATGHWRSGGGGSGYIGSSNLTSLSGVTKHMYCYSCGTNQTADSYRTTVGTCANATANADCSKSGHGYARITRLN